eukprot:4575991-Amphidinium_carterae.1
MQFSFAERELVAYHIRRCSADGERLMRVPRGLRDHAGIVTCVLSNQSSCVFDRRHSPCGIEVLSRLGTLQYVRTHTLGIHARPNSMSTPASAPKNNPGEPQRKYTDQYVGRAMEAIGLSEKNAADRDAFYAVAKTVDGASVVFNSMSAMLET